MADQGGKPPDPPDPNASNTNTNSQQGVINKTTQNRIILEYTSADTPPYEVFVQGKSQNVGNFHIMSIAKTIFNLKLKEIIKIDRKDRYAGEPAAIWVQFQTAAGTVTSLYRESSESLRKTNELAKQSGFQKRNIEIFNWAKRKRRLIRREDLLAYLSGKHPPPPSRQLHNHHHSHHRLSPRPRNLSPPPNVANVEVDPNLRTFREALVTSPLCAFITGEMARHTKRPASPSDVTMGSPNQHKRTRYM